MDEAYKELGGANMDIDLTSGADVPWEQSQCPWNEQEETNEHKCAVKSISLCRYFCGVRYPDKVLCCYPNENPVAR